ncbi:MAG: hypothetical protein AVDCRST_MAG77-3213, partial [uncultured Chloroflexi bacterium]
WWIKTPCNVTGARPGACRCGRSAALPGGPAQRCGPTRRPAGCGCRTTSRRRRCGRRWPRPPPVQPVPSRTRAARSGRPP